MDYPNVPPWREEDVQHIVERTVPPGEKKHGFDDRDLFIETLTLAVASLDDGQILVEGLLGALAKKWPEAVEEQLPEAKKLFEQAKAEGVLDED